MNNDYAIVLVAHPDDEFIFAHNFITQWHGNVIVVCATYAPESARGVEFLRSVNSMRELVQSKHPDRTVIGVSLGLPDDMYDSPSPTVILGLLKSKLLALTQDVGDVHGDLAIERIVSHNPFGEYGHKHHQVCHEAARQLARDSGGVPFYVFSQNYGLPEERYVDVQKLRSPVLEIYERELYMIYNFNLIEEGLIRYG